MADFLQPISQFIQTRLLADTALVALVGGSGAARIYNGDAIPQGVAFPYVAYSPLSLLNRNALPATVTMFAMPVMWIRTVVSGRDLTQAYSIIRRINAALINQSGNVTVSGETYYLGPWFWRTTRTITEDEGTLHMTTVGVEMESRVQLLS